ncbi:cupin domain-containing protein [Xanthomonas euvesicatoria pv. allii]|uniref:cupin domain-containing protein n=1 Tax=Xanthomonas euvesicatoria TaxID=456327 RepID=UPI00240508F2|nr:cupin domain-containing protein [Xanthomonas euvesicatoria]MCP3039094.1 cupin domain-containing protein [Xanthomonas euvesicatoria pv. allii]MCP3051137.1 cupin domain-containing protein [Xanthomonas euvesicatoria pv. allii]
MHPTAAALIRSLDLAPHPEGGHYRRIHASARQVTHNGQTRPAMTAIRFLLSAGECSAWHRVDAEETWHWQLGDALELLIYDTCTEQVQRVIVDAAERGEPMHVVPAGCWQAARSLGDFTLVGCTVSPGFVWEGFALLDKASPLAARLATLLPR